MSPGQTGRNGHAQPGAEAPGWSAQSGQTEQPVAPDGDSGSLHTPMACHLTCLPCLSPWVFRVSLADGVAGCLGLVLRAFRPAGAGPGGFRRAGGGAGPRRTRRNPARTRPGVRRPGGAAAARGAGCRRRAAGRGGAGVGGDDEPGPAVGGGGVAELRAGPAELLLAEPEDVLKEQAGMPA